MTNFKARPTVYKGVQMRSRLEAGFAVWLDKVNLRWEYEPTAFASPEGQYLPDFRVLGLPIIGAVADAYFEVKPHPQPTPRHYASTLEKQLSVIWDSEPDALIFNVYPVNEMTEPMFQSGIETLRRIADGHSDAYGSRGVLLPAKWTRSAVAGQPPVGVAMSLSPIARPWPDNWWEVAPSGA